MACLLLLAGGCGARDEHPARLSTNKPEVLPTGELEVFPTALLEKLTLHAGEIPEFYRLITDREMLEQAGVTENPAYVFRQADRDLQLKIGAAAGFLALYGRGEEVRLVLQGYYFPDREDAGTYAEVQQSRERRVVALQRELVNGVWLIMIAADPEEVYVEAEIAAVRKGITRYARRLGCERLFDQFHGNPEGDAE